jgi:type IV pilus assembly protein PilN
MIRINLLPVRQAKKKEMGRQQLVLFGGLVALAIGLNLVWSFNLRGELSQKQGDVLRRQNEIKQLEKIIGEVNTISQDKKALEDKLAVLEELRKNRTGPVKVLDTLTTVLPQRVWLTGIEEKAGSMVMKGGALNNEDLADLMRELKKSPFFSEPALKQSVQKSDKDVGSKFIEWELTCGVKYSA